MKIIVKLFTQDYSGILSEISHFAFKITTFFFKTSFQVLKYSIKFISNVIIYTVPASIRFISNVIISTVPSSINLIKNVFSENDLVLRNTNAIKCKGKIYRKKFMQTEINQSKIKPKKRILGNYSLFK